jgi:hypothetical protein
VHYVPNAGHDLVQKVPGTKGIPPIAALTTLGVFVRCQLNGQPFPQLEWKHDDHDGRPRVAVTTTGRPEVCAALGRSRADAGFPRSHMEGTTGHDCGQDRHRRN